MEQQDNLIMDGAVAPKNSVISKAGDRLFLFWYLIIFRLFTLSRYQLAHAAGC
jgi:hypothetical protein